MWQKSEPLVTHSVGESVVGGGRVSWNSPPQRAVWQYLSKPKMQVPFHSVIPLLGIYLKDITHVQSDMYTSLFTVLLFIIAKILEMT